MPLVARFLAVLVILSSASAHAKQLPRVVVSIAPIHSLAAGVMAGVSVPQLLIEPSTDPHTYALKPSQMSALQHADLVIWMGETVEGYMSKAIMAAGKGPKELKLTTVPGMILLPARKGGMWEQDVDEHEHGHDEHGDIDGHLWLDIGNAKAMVNAMLAALKDLDPEHAAQYQRNGSQMLQHLNALDNEIRALLSPVSAKPYLVFHDAYRYFEARYQLNAAGAISVDPERRPGARRLSEIRRKIETHKIVCVFSQPQFSGATVRTVTEGTAVKHSHLDDLGGELEIGPNLYFKMMRNLAENLRACLN